MYERSCLEASISFASSSLSSRSSAMALWREQGVVVEADLCVEHLELAVAGDDQRVHLEHAHVFGGEGVVEARQQTGACLAWSPVRFRAFASACA